MGASKCTVWGLGLLAIGLLAGCRGSAQIPYDLSAVATRPRPVHPVRVAILPLEDAREAREAPDPRGRYAYSGLSYRGTRLEALGAAPTARLTELVARHLARTRVFAQVILVLRPEQAPEADLFLTGRVRRARGYVEAEAPAEPSGRPPESRKVLAEVVLEDLTLRGRGDAPALLEVDVGWSIAETRAVDAEGFAPDPWAVLGEALNVAVDDLAGLVARADLSGDYVVTPKVALELPPVGTATLAAPFAGLAEAPPLGWRRAATSSTARPAGWAGAPGCAHLRLEAQQTRRFSRLLGPYTPALEVWACPDDLHLKFQGRADHPARLLGRRDRRWYFSQALGRSNWPDAEADVAAYLALQPPPGRYLFEVGTARITPVMKPRLRLAPRKALSSDK